MILRFAPYIAIALLALGLWGMHERGKNLKAERDAARQEAETYAQVVAAEKVRQRELEKLRTEYEALQRKLREIPDDGCLDRRIPDAVRLLLSPNSQAGHSGAGTEGGS